MDRRIGIVLGGGGTLGDFQVGALKFFYEKGILPHTSCVCGTSIGAINAVIVSTGVGCDELLERYWSENVIGRDDLIPQHEWSEHVAPMLDAFLLAEKSPKLPMERRIRSIGRMRAIAAIMQESRGVCFGISRAQLTTSKTSSEPPSQRALSTRWTSSSNGWKKRSTI
jgi:hypothetical protein